MVFQHNSKTLLITKYTHHEKPCPLGGVVNPQKVVPYMHQQRCLVQRIMHMYTDVHARAQLVGRGGKVLSIYYSLGARINYRGSAHIQRIIQSEANE